ncbi:MAG: hypothetical protein LBD70_03245, partial [Bifidobacteriaceae bacterium]|nr:hypothetical protein [Bifidobacteriaceae bacterium]
MDTDLDTLATALYVTIDDLLKDHPEWAPPRPAEGSAPRTTDSESITVAVLGALLGHTNERRWVRVARQHLTGHFPNIPGQSGYNKRLRKLAETINWVRDQLARSTDQWSDGLWLADSTPVERGRSKTTVKRSEMAGDAQYGYRASHTRHFWGMRLHLPARPSGLIVSHALTGAKADQRDTLVSILSGLERRPGQIIESINATLKTHLDIERHRARTPRWLTTRVG